jgi:arylsulfatase
MTTHTRRSFLKVSAAAALSGCTLAPRPRVARKPNIVYILADDLGYGDLGCYGQLKIETPNIDRLCAAGMRFTAHYSGSPVCAPSRCVLLTGKHTGHAYIRGNDEWAERGKVWDFQAMLDDPKLEGQRPLPTGTPTLGTLLQSAGYATACVGKWGLGAPGTEGVPNRQGFDLFFGYNCQRQAHTYYPTHLYKNEKRVPLRNGLVAPGTKLAAGADPHDQTRYARYTQPDYAPDLMLQEIRSFVSENRARPFFLYWATPIPHVALQAPQRWVDHYVKKFGDEPPYDGKQGYFPHRYPHACYAAMISYLDEQVGQLVNQLKTLGLYEDTLLLFSSDNGPTFNGGTDSPWFDSARPFKSEAGWGKCSLHEGGIRVPLIAAWPGRIKPGSQSDLPCAFWDILPTLCEVAGADAPADTDGISFAPTLLGTRTQREHTYLYWEYPEAGGHQAVRLGRWKALRSGIKKRPLTTALYDLEADPREERDVAQQHPDIVGQAEQLMRDARIPPALDAFKLPALGD